MSGTFHTKVNDVIPWNANYTFPAQETRAHRQCVKIQPKTGGTYNSGNIIRFEFPADGYLNCLNSYLQFDLKIVRDNGAAMTVATGNYSAASNTITITTTNLDNAKASTVFAGKTIAASNSLVGQVVEYTNKRGVLCNAPITGHVLSTADNILAVDVWDIDTSAGIKIYSAVFLGEGGAHELIKRVRVMYGGLVLEDILEYAQYARFLLSQGASENYLGHSGNVLEGTYANNLAESHTNPTIGYVESVKQLNYTDGYTYCLKLFAGLLNSKKLIPLKYMAAQFTVEITLNDSKALICSDTVHSAPDFTLSEVNWMAELVDFDSTYDASLYLGMMEMGVPIKFTSVHTHRFNITGPSVHAQIHERARSCKNLFGVCRPERRTFATDSHAMFYDLAANPVSPFLALNVAYAEGVSNGFISQYQTRLGGKYYPAQPVRCLKGASEAFVEMLKMIDAYGDYTFSTNISNHDWTKNVHFSALDQKEKGRKFAMCITYENPNIFGEDNISGINAEEQSDLHLTFQSNSYSSDSTLKKELVVFVQYDSLLVIRANNLVDLAM